MAFGGGDVIAENDRDEQRKVIKAYIKAAQREVTRDQITAYYLDPLIQLVHICLSIARYQNDQNLLAHDLKVSPSRLLAAINKLEQLQ